MRGQRRERMLSRGYLWRRTLRPWQRARALAFEVLQNILQTCWARLPYNSRLGPDSRRSFTRGPLGQHVRRRCVGLARMVRAVARAMDRDHAPAARACARYRTGS